MMPDKRAPVIAVVGPSGVGKDSVLQAMCATDPSLRLVRRTITRAEDAGGEAFDAVDNHRFQEMVDAGSFALHWNAHGLRYGIPATINTLRQQAPAVLVNLSRGVLSEAEQAFGDLRVILLTARREILAQRLASRGRETRDEIERRLDRLSVCLPVGLRSVHEIDNSGALQSTVAAALAVFQPESA
ncbi:MAG: phosphonate metabolism protein/1,5-bisphosphokinase (PRPP-forming) PhnN [Pseudomonadota bacterium]